MEKKWYGLTVRQPIKLMEALLDTFGPSAHMSLEGDLSRGNINKFSIVSDQANELFPRNTSFPLQQFAIIPLDEATKERFKRQLLPTIGIRNRIHHLLVERDGQIIFRSYDWFSLVSIRGDSIITDDFLTKLVESRALRDFCA